MKQYLLVFVIALLAVTAVSATDATPLANSKWSIRGDVNATYLYNVKGLNYTNFTHVSGYVNAYANVGNGNETQGVLFMKAYDTVHKKWITHTVSWSSKDMEQPIIVKVDNEKVTSFSGRGTEKFGSGVPTVYKNVPVSIYYSQSCHRVTIKGRDFHYEQVRVENVYDASHCLK